MGAMSSMKKLSIFLVLMMFFGLFYLTTSNSVVQTTLVKSNRSVIAQTLSEPISITSNGEFESLGFLGTGIPSDPYRIENLHFILNETLGTRTAINIHGTNKSFVIANCIFEGFVEDFGDWTDVAGEGIKLIEVQNGEISNCVFDTMRHGVSFEGSEAVIVRGCSFSSNYTMLADHGGEELVTEYAGAAIKIDSFDAGSSAIDVLDCVMENYGYGIEIAGNSNDISTVNNTITECNGGIHPQGSYSVIISNNTCLYNVYEGIALQQTHGSSVVWNNCSFNKRVGIMMDESSSNNIIEYNIVESNGNATTNSTTVLAQDVVYAGIWIVHGSYGNQIESNDFIDNGMSARNDVSGNTYDYNYYSEYSGTDVDGDLIGDTPHSILGDSPTQDNHPRMTRLEFESSDDPTESPTSPTNPNGPAVPDLIMYVAIAGGVGIVLVVAVILKRR
jgi:parallel beta-helix repeat protein